MGRRRANGEGTVRKRADGRWEARVSLPDGKRKSYFGRTRAEASARMTDGLQAARDGLPVPSDALTVRRFLSRWLDAHKATIRQSTWRRYDSLLRVHALPALGAHRLTRLEPRHLQTLYADLLESLSPSSVRQLHAVLRRALSDAVKWGNVVRNVADLVNPPRLETPEMTPWTQEQARRFLAAVKGDRFEALYVLALSTGMRQGEILALRWADVDLNTEALHVRRTLQWGKDRGATFGEPKSKRSRRSIRLSPHVVEALRRHRARQAGERLRLGPAWQDHDLVFTDSIGGPIRPPNLLRRSFKPAIERAQVPVIRFHDLRHTAATLLLRKGVHVKIVSELLGHSKISLTLDTYSHLLPDMQEKAVAAMEALLG